MIILSTGRIAYDEYPQCHWEVSKDAAGAVQYEVGSHVPNIKRSNSSCSRSHCFSSDSYHEQHFYLSHVLCILTPPRASLLDTQGPEIRTGMLKDDKVRQRRKYEGADQILTLTSLQAAGIGATGFYISLYHRSLMEG